MKRHLNNTARKNSRKSISLSLLLPFAFPLFTFYLLLLPCAVDAAHRYHTSLTRMDYNAQEKTVEISIQLFSHDLVPVLERKYGKQIDLETTENIDKLILDYLNENFVLKNKNGEAAKLKWVGKELNVDLTYVYAEIPFDESLENAKLENTIFFESFAEQTNLVICRFEQKKADLLFKVGDSYKEVRVRAAGEN